MENSTAYHNNLITKYLSGEVSEEEIRVLTEWIQTDPEHQKLFDECRNTWLAIENSKIDSTDVDTEWNKLKLKITGGQVDKRTGGQADRRTSGQADKRISGRMRSHKVGVIRSKSGFTALPLYNTIRINSSSHWAFRIAAIFFLVAIPSFLLFRYFNNSGNTVIKAQDQMVDINLPDGTSVSLNRGSTIEYPQHFKGKTREIVLTGEGYFNVKHSEKSKFIIVSGNVRIEDIGTSFYVNTSKTNGMMEVILTEGKASVYFNDNPSGQIFILPGEKADIRITENTIGKSINDDVNFLAWKTKKLIFSNNTMSEVVVLLNKVYQTDLKLSGTNINNCRLTAIFDNQSLESVLNVIKSTLNVSIISNGSTIEISGNECDY